MRYGLWDRVDSILLDAHRKYSIFGGLLFGLAGFVDVFDAFLLSKDVKYLEMAKRPIAGIRDISLVKQSEGSTTPGDGLFRSSCDFATGSAGVMRALHRYAHLEEADFVLDEVVSESEITVGSGQYRNAVASGRIMPETDPTLPRYGTDLLQVRTKLESTR